MAHFKEALVRANLGEYAEAILTVVDLFRDIRDMDAGDMEEVEKILTSLGREVSRFRCGGAARGSRGRQSVRNGGRPRALGVPTSYRA